MMLFEQAAKPLLPEGAEGESQPHGGEGVAGWEVEAALLVRRTLDEVGRQLRTEAEQRLRGGVHDVGSYDELLEMWGGHPAGDGRA
eukprot:COSAG01_NODE_19227_length_1023_cov_1.444805_1_plen_85_part_01